MSTNYTEQLQSPFAESDYEWRVQRENRDGTKVVVLCYVTARAIQSRLDDLFGPWGWRAAYHAGPDGGVVCELSIKDPESHEWVTKEDAASNTQIEAVKGGISGALKRAAVVWGIGRHLYKLDATVVPLGDRGQHYHKTKSGQHKYWDDPKLPAWAVADNGKAAPNRQKPLDSSPAKVSPKRAFMQAWEEAARKTQTAPIKAPIHWKALIVLLCNKGKDLQDICMQRGWETPLPTMSAESSGWLVLAEFVNRISGDPDTVKAFTASAMLAQSPQKESA